MIGILWKGKDYFCILKYSYKDEKIMKDITDSGLRESQKFKYVFYPLELKMRNE